MIRVGINPLTWTNDDLPSLGADTPLEVCLAEAKQAGYAGIELGNKFPRDAAVLGPILERHGLDLVSGWFSGRLLERSVDEELRALEPHLSLLEALGSRVLVYAETTGAVHCDRGVGLSRRPVLDPSRWAGFCADLTEVAERTLGRGVRLAYHHHMGTVVQTAREIDLLLQHTGDAVSLLLDTGHLSFAGEDPTAVARRHSGRIAHVHAKDYRPAILRDAVHRDLPFLDAVLAGVFTVPGDGAVDYLGLFETLRDARYEGWIVVEAEQDPARAHPLTYARMGRENIASFLERSGL
ncbi:MAG: myo-inosose-2 dehydratase [Deltaproteobacteria bacterium]|nr:myo-inosose-2 dehydratase [Deltaproteobacteria bacterium]